MLATPDQVNSHMPTSEDVLIRCGAWIRRTALRLRDRMPWAEVDDLTQQGIMTALEMRERYHPERGVPFEAFIKPRVFGSMIDMLRQSGAMVRREGELVRSLEEADVDPGAVELLIASENLSALTSAIEKLPEQERTVISLFYLEEFTNAEIARLLNLSEPTASRVRHRAIAMLARSIITDGYPPPNTTFAETET